MQTADYDSRWTCAFGYHHVVPSLAQFCRGHAVEFNVKDPGEAATSRGVDTATEER